MLMAGDVEYAECNEFEELNIDDPADDNSARYRYKVGVIYWGEQPASVIQATTKVKKAKKGRERIMVIYGKADPDDPDDPPTSSYITIQRP